LTQSAMLHVNGSRIDRDRVSRSLRLLQSTSPSYLLLAALDAARHQMALHGADLMSATIKLAQTARTRISLIEGLKVVELITPTPGAKYLDPTRLTVDVTGLNLTGFTADEILTALGIVAELPSIRNLTFIISLGNSLADIDRLVSAFSDLAANYAGDMSLNIQSIDLDRRIFTELAITPRQANQSHQIGVPVEHSIGKISAESICPYPPGIPILISGEIITASAIDHLRQILDLGGEVVGCSDPALEQIRIIDPKTVF
jgi:arginine decarboxylase